MGLPEVNKEVILANMQPLSKNGREFYIDEIQPGDRVLLGTSLLGGLALYIDCDVENLDQNVWEKLTPEGLERAFERAGKLETSFPDLDEEQRRELHAYWRAARIAQKLLGVPQDDFSRTLSFRSYPVGDNTYAKPLSKAKGKAACTEYAILVHLILRKLERPPLRFVSGQIEQSQEEGPEPHAYLTKKDGTLVVDPMLSVEPSEDWPPPIAYPEEPITTKILEEGKRVPCRTLRGWTQAYGATSS